MSNKHNILPPLYDLLDDGIKKKIHNAEASMPLTVGELMNALTTKFYVKDLKIEEAIDLYMISGGEVDGNVIDFAFSAFKRN